MSVVRKSNKTHANLKFIIYGIRYSGLGLMAAGAAALFYEDQLTNFFGLDHATLTTIAFSIILMGSIAYIIIPRILLKANI